MKEVKPLPVSRVFSQKSARNFSEIYLSDDSLSNRTTIAFLGVSTKLYCFQTCIDIVDLSIYVKTVHSKLEALSDPDSKCAV